MATLTFGQSGTRPYGVLTVTETATNIANNTSTLAITLTLKRPYNVSSSATKSASCTVNGTTYNWSGTIGGSGDKVLINKTQTVTHNSDGRKSISIQAQIDLNITWSGSWVGTISGSDTMTLTYIPRQATLTYAPSTFTDEQNPIIQYSNPAGNNATSLRACITFDGSVDDIPWRDVSKTGSSYTFQLTNVERNTLREKAKNSNSISLRFYLATVIGGQTYISQKNGTCTIANANPTIGSVAYKDSNSTTAGITGNNQIIIRNKSNALFTATTLNAYKYATLTKITVTCNNKTVTANLSGSSVSTVDIDMGTIDSGSNVQAQIVLTDSRGNTASKTLTVSMADWVQPSAIISCQRQNNFYSETNILVDGSISSLNDKNKMTITCQYKKVSDTAYSQSVTLEDNVTTTLSLDNNYQWNIKVIVADLIGSTTYNLTVDRGIPIVFYDRTLRSVGVNCFPSQSESLEVNGKQLAPTRVNVTGQATTTNTLTYTGVSITIPAGHMFVLSGCIAYNTQKPLQVTLALSDSNGTYCVACNEATQVYAPLVCTGTDYAASDTTIYLWAKWANNTSTQTPVWIKGYYIPV